MLFLSLSLPPSLLTPLTQELKKPRTQELKNSKTMELKNSNTAYNVSINQIAPKFVSCRSTCIDRPTECLAYKCTDLRKLDARIIM